MKQGSKFIHLPILVSLHPNGLGTRAQRHIQSTCRSMRGDLTSVCATELWPSSQCCGHWGISLPWLWCTNCCACPEQKAEWRGPEDCVDPVQTHSAALDRLLRRLCWVRAVDSQTTDEKRGWYFKYPGPGPWKAFKGSGLLSLAR